MTIRAIFIDTVNRVIEEIHIEPELAVYYRLINCRAVDFIPLENGDTFYLDDEGLLQEDGQVFFQYSDYVQPFAGNAIVVGTRYTDEGTADTHAKSTLEELKSKVSFLNEGEFTKPEPVFEFIGWSGLD
jgi:hypothetical protein